MIFKNALVSKSLSSTNFEIVFIKKPTLLNVIILKYREEFINGYNFMNNTVNEKLLLYGKDFLRVQQKPRNCTKYSEDYENIQIIPNIA